MLPWRRLIIWNKQDSVSIFCCLLFRTPSSTSALCSSAKLMMLGSWRRTWTGGSVWSTPSCLATSPNRRSSATDASSAPNPPFWFASATLTTSYSRGRSSWLDWPRACRRSWQRLTVGWGRVPSHPTAPPPALLLYSPLWIPAPPMQSGPLLWHHCDAIDRPLLGVAAKNGKWRKDNRLCKNLPGEEGALTWRRSGPEAPLSLRQLCTLHTRRTKVFNALHTVHPRHLCSPQHPPTSASSYTLVQESSSSHTLKNNSSVNSQFPAVFQLSVKTRAEGRDDASSHSALGLP